MLSSKESKGRHLYGPAVLLGSSLAAHFDWLGPVCHTVLLWHGVAVIRSGASSH